MKLILALAAALAVATPALSADTANFTGPRAEVVVGANNVVNSTDRNKVVYGAAVGYDLPVGESATIGAHVNTSNIFESQRTLGASARLGFALTQEALAYGSLGYSNYRAVGSVELDGVTAGAGFEYVIAPNAFAKIEYNFSDFQRNVSVHTLVTGVGYRF